MEQWQLIVAIIGGVLFILVAGITIIVWCKRCASARLFAPVGPVAGSYGSAASKLWVGSGANPTEDCAIDVAARARAVVAELARPQEEVDALTRVALNFCRSTGHERVLSAPMGELGRRRCKFWSIVSDARVNEASLAEGGPAEARILLTLITPATLASSKLLPVASVKSMAAFRALLTSLRHPHVLPTYDATLTLDGHLAVLRPFHAEGSVRDLLYSAPGIQRPHPGVRASYHAKYQSVDGLTGVVFTRPARPLRIEMVARFGMQVLEALKYLESQSVPYFHLHTGNVIVGYNNPGIGAGVDSPGSSGNAGSSAFVSDYENAFCGLKHRLFKKLRRLPRVDPQLAAYAAFMYEMSTGIEVQNAPGSRRSGGDYTGQRSPSPSPSPMSPNSPNSLPSTPGGSGGGLDFLIPDPKYALVNDLIQSIVNANHEVSYDELLAHALFRSVKATPFIRPPARPLDSRTAKLLGPVLSFNTATLFPGHPNLSAINLPTSSVRIGASSSLTTVTSGGWSAAGSSSSAASSAAGSFVGDSPLGTPGTSSAAAAAAGSLSTSLLAAGSPSSNQVIGREKDKKHKKKKQQKQQKESSDNDE